MHRRLRYGSKLRVLTRSSSEATKLSGGEVCSSVLITKENLSIWRLQFQRHVNAKKKVPKRCEVFALRKAFESERAVLPQQRKCLQSPCIATHRSNDGDHSWDYRRVYSSQSSRS